MRTTQSPLDDIFISDGVGFESGDIGFVVFQTNKVCDYRITLGKGTPVPSVLKGWHDASQEYHVEIFHNAWGEV